jgi:hypothetical protein
MAAPQIEKKAAEVARDCELRVRTALVKPHEYRLTEDYYIAQVRPVVSPDGVLSASALIARFGSEIAQIVRGETVPLSDEERAEVLNSRLSYYPNDLLIVGWTGALICDTSEGAAPHHSAPGIRELAVAGVSALRPSSDRSARAGL